MKDAKDFEVEIKFILKYKFDQSMVEKVVEDAFANDDKNYFNEWLTSEYGISLQKSAVQALGNNPELLQEMVISRAIFDASMAIERELRERDISFEDMCSTLTQGMEADPAAALNNLIQSEREGGDVLECNLPALYHMNEIDGHAMDGCLIIVGNNISVAVK